MRRRVFLHVGASKTGTTYLQGMCDANREALASAGLLFPSPLVDHFRFMRCVFGNQHGRSAPRAARLGFDRMVSAALEYEGSVLISNELLAAASPAQIDRIVRAFDGADIHLVYTVRDLARTLPAEWQQAVKGGSTISLDAFVAGVMERFGAGAAESDDVPPVVGESHVVEKFAFLHDVPAVMRRWDAHVPATSIHLVTLPPPGADHGLLWQRFCAAIRVDPHVAEIPARRRNESLGVVEAETMRRINTVLSAEGGYDFSTSERVRTNFVLPVVAAGSRGKRIAIRPEHHDWAVRQAGLLLKRLDVDYDVIGDLADLVPPATAPRGVHPDEVSTEEVAQRAVSWIAKLVTLATGTAMPTAAPSADGSPDPQPGPSDVIEPPVLEATEPAVAGA